jgi:hypothetical protein
MNNIVERVFGSDTEDRRLVLSNQSYARKLAIGTDWTTIRIGLRMWFSNGVDLTTLTGTPLLVLGMQVGDTTFFGGDDTQFWLGVKTGQSVWSTQNTVDGLTAFWTNSSWNRGWKVGTDVNETIISSTSGYFTKAPTEKCSAFVVELNKASSTSVGFTFTRKSTYNNASGHMSRQIFWEGMEASPAASWSMYSSHSATRTDVPEAMHALDSVGICWNRRVPALEISDIVVVRVA